MEAKGYKKWVIPCGFIPTKSTGKEPDLLSQDKIAVLNLNKKPVKIKMTVYYTEEEPTVFNPVEVKGERVRKIRINDLINPFPVVLDKEYSLVIEADKPIVVQLLKMNTGYRNLAMMGTMGFGSTKKGWKKIRQL